MKFHTSLPVRDLSQSLPFYELLLGEGPVKTKKDYAKFLPSCGGLNLALHENPGAEKSLLSLHLGIQFEDQKSLDQAEARMREGGYISSSRDTSVCCYASQDKVWVTDPNGYKWEMYVLLEDREEKMDAELGCCAGKGKSGAENANASSHPTCC